MGGVPSRAGAAVTAYAADVPQLLVTSHRQDCTITVHPAAADSFVLEPVAATVSMSASEVPRMRCEVRVAVPDDQVDLDLFDPRMLSRITIDAGYVFPSGRRSVAPLADLHLAYRNVQRPSDEMTIRGDGDEFLVTRRGVDTAMSRAATSSTLGEITWLVQDRLPGAAVGITPGTPDRASAAYELAVGADPWQQVETLADAAGVEVYADGDAHFTIRAQPAVGVPVHVLNVGTAGTVETSNSDIDRPKFANAVVVEHRWRPAAGGDDQVVTGKAFALGRWAWGGPAGKALVTFRRDTVTDQDSADLEAMSLLYRRLAAGRGVVITALNAFWVRPGDTVDVALRLGPTMRQIVQSVTFDLVGGSMTVTTRDPDEEAT